MKVASVLLCVTLMFMLSPQLPTIDAQQKPQDLAQKAAESWLALCDSGKYAESWDEASSGFKAAVTKDKWIGMLQQARTPLGTLQSRKLQSADYKKDPPGAPAGEYVILKFDASFEKVPSATETVSMVLDKDGKWRATGYYIRPAGM
jgi:Protein of unknown function (DUF4019)